jgi:hypothetical protein
VGSYSVLLASKPQIRDLFLILRLRLKEMKVTIVHPCVPNPHQGSAFSDDIESNLLTNPEDGTAACGTLLLAFTVI